MNIPSFLFICCSLCLSGHVQLESLPHPVVVHLLPFFKLLAAFLQDCICQVDALSDKHYWMVKCSLNVPPPKIFLKNLFTKFERAVYIIRHHTACLSTQVTQACQFKVRNVLSCLKIDFFRFQPRVIFTLINVLSFTTTGFLYNQAPFFYF